MKELTTLFHSTYKICFRLIYFSDCLQQYKFSIFEARRRLMHIIIISNIFLQQRKLIPFLHVQSEPAHRRIRKLPENIAFLIKLVQLAPPVAKWVACLQIMSFLGICMFSALAEYRLEFRRPNLMTNCPLYYPFIMYNN